MIGGIRGLPPSGAVKKDLNQSGEKRSLSASGEKKMMSGKKSYSFHYDSSKDETFQKSPHFLRTLSMPRTDGGFEESLTAFQETLGQKKEQKPERKKTKLDLIIEKETENLRELYKEETKNRAQVNYPKNMKTLVLFLSF